MLVAVVILLMLTTAGDGVLRDAVVRLNSAGGL